MRRFLLIKTQKGQRQIQAKFKFTKPEPVCTLRLLQSGLKFLHQPETGVPPEKRKPPARISPQPVAPHRDVHFLRPGVNPAAQAADTLQPVSHKKSSGIKSILPLITPHEKRTFVRAAGHNL